MPGLRAGTIKTYDDAAGSSAFGDGAARWHDPRPRARDPSRNKPVSSLPTPETKKILED